MILSVLKQLLKRKKKKSILEIKVKEELYSLTCFKFLANYLDSKAVFLILALKSW